MNRELTRVRHCPGIFNRTILAIVLDESIEDVEAEAVLHYPLKLMSYSRSCWAGRLLFERLRLSSLAIDSKAPKHPISKSIFKTWCRIFLEVIDPEQHSDADFTAGLYLTCTVLAHIMGLDFAELFKFARKAQGCEDVLPSSFALHVAARTKVEGSSWVLVHDRYPAGPSSHMLRYHAGYLDLNQKNGMSLTELILAGGANPRARVAGQTAFHYAASLGCEEAVRQLLAKEDAHRFMNLKNDLGKTALVLAIMGRHEEVARYLFYTEDIHHYVHDSDGNLALWHAVDRGCSRELLETLLVSYGDMINRHNGRDGSALLRAVMRSDEAIVRLLLDRGATVNDGCLAVGRGIDDGDAPFPLGPLQWAVANGNLSIATMLINAGADVDAGFPLHLAITQDRTDLVELLIDRGSSLGRRWNGVTPLEFAQQVGGNSHELIASKLQVLKAMLRRCGY